MTHNILLLLQTAMDELDETFKSLSNVVTNLNGAREVGDNSAVTSDIIEHCRQTKDLIVRDLKALTDYTEGVKDIDETQKQP